MKRILTATVLLAALSFSACKKTEVTQVIENTQTIVTTIKPTDWKATDNTNTEYVATVNMPEIDQDMLANGGVLVYASFDAASQTYDALPATISNYVLTSYHSLGSLSIDLTFFASGSFPAPTANVPVKIMLIRAGSVSN